MTERKPYERTAPPPKVTPIIRQSIVQAAKAGHKKARIAREFGLSRVWVYQILREDAPETIGKKKKQNR